MNWAAPILTQKRKTAKDAFHLFKWPGATFETPAVAGKVKTAYLLSDRKPLPVKQEGGRVSVTLPENAPKSLANVLCLDIHEK
jgi:hypothetical protein